jgi:hypothetical protein
MPWCNRSLKKLENYYWELASVAAYACPQLSFVGEYVGESTNGKSYKEKLRGPYTARALIPFSDDSSSSIRPALERRNCR